MTSWVLIDQSNGAKCHNGDALSEGALERIAEAVTVHMNRDYASEWGTAGIKIRVGKNASDVSVAEQACLFVSDFPQEQDASAYHTLTAAGIPVSFVAVTTCSSLFGPNGVTVDVSHEFGEAEADPGVNILADDMKGFLHAFELYDPVEIQAYPINIEGKHHVHVSNFVTRKWFIPGSAGPYDFMTNAGLPGADPKYAPAGPMMTAPSPDGSGNYQMVEPGGAGSLKAIFGRLFQGRGMRIVGTPRKLVKTLHWSSRTQRRLEKRGPYAWMKS
jgi:hypothetical protein